MGKRGKGDGFKDLCTFNMAMLVIQGWRIMHQLDLLVSRILKARYFPNGSVMDAHAGANPSFKWRRILEGRKTLENI